MTSCVEPARMCFGGTDCGPSASCVAGRCLGHGATPAISTSRRVLYAPEEVACVRRGEAGVLPEVALLGGSSEAVALFRFALPLPAEATVVEAYLLIERATDVDPDPAGVALHAERVVSPWDAGSLSWATRPRLEYVGAPVTRVFPASGHFVRIDVRPIVERWRRRVTREFGLAIVGEPWSGRPTRGLAFALAPMPGASTRRDAVLAMVAPTAPVSTGLSDPESDLDGPRLELYLR